MAAQLAASQEGLSSMSDDDDVIFFFKFTNISTPHDFCTLKTASK
jgi:hypothetical protein